MKRLESRKVIVLERRNTSVFSVEGLLDRRILEMRISAKQRMHNLMPEVGEEVQLERLIWAENGQLIKYRK